MRSLTILTAPRRAIGLILVLVLALTGQSLSHIALAPDAAAQMVICTGDGPRVVHVDADGQPAAPPHHCPDCALFLVVVTPPPILVPMPFAAAGLSNSWPQGPLAATWRNPLPQRARAPPFSV